MNEKRMVVLEGSLIHSEQDFHNQISKLLNFGPYYGYNLDALWDMISSGIGDFCYLRWVDSSFSKKTLGNECFNTIISLFNEVKKNDAYIGKNDRGFDYSLE